MLEPAEGLTSLHAIYQAPNGGRGRRREGPPPPEVVIGTRPLDLGDFERVAEGGTVGIAAATRRRIAQSAAALDAALASGSRIYGVTTRYGAASAEHVPVPKRRAFQEATLRSHACGTGPPLAWAIARGTWLTKLTAIATGLTGASAELAAHLCALLGTPFAPAVPATGSLGASGDLIPAAHAALPLIGEGEVVDRHGERHPATHALEAAGLAPLGLGPRDGLSLVNGTSVTTAIGAANCLGASRFLRTAAVVAAASLETVGGHPEAFSTTVVDARPHPGAQASAQLVRRALAGFTPPPAGASAHDPYAWRCVPQVHGAAGEALDWATRTTVTELNASSDNPICTPGGTIVSGGNFHGAPLGLPYDALALAIREVAALSRQRLAHLSELSGGRLVMVLTSATAALLEASTLSPATGRWLPADSVEDHVSNATVAARRVGDTLDLAWRGLAAEALGLVATAEARRVPLRSQAAKRVLALVAANLTLPLDLDSALARPLAAIGAALAAGSLDPSPVGGAPDEDARRNGALPRAGGRRGAGGPKEG